MSRFSEKIDIVLVYMKYELHRTVTDKIHILMNFTPGHVVDDRRLNGSCNKKKLLGWALRPNLDVSGLFLEAQTGYPTGRIFMKFHIWWFLENLPRKFKFH
jgi:hypothetical protein